MLWVRMDSEMSIRPRTVESGSVCSMYSRPRPRFNCPEIPLARIAAHSSLKLGGSERDNYSQLGNNFKTATSRQLVGKLEDDCFENASQVGTHFYQCCTNGNEATRLSTCDHDGHKFRGGSPIEIVPMMGTIIVSNFCSS